MDLSSAKVGRGGYQIRRRPDAAPLCRGRRAMRRFEFAAGPAGQNRKQERSMKILLALALLIAPVLAGCGGGQDMQCPPVPIAADGGVGAVSGPVDPCCIDPVCCGDPCCGDPCCGDPCCGDPCCGDPTCAGLRFTAPGAPRVRSPARLPLRR